jgi:APA family basic amino acid/polyamine antiporter
MNRQQLFARKAIATPAAASEVSALGLRRVLSRWELTALGIGAIIGAGIFAATGSAIAGDALRPGAGPAIIISFFITGLTCGFAALCYAEFAAMVPIAGSAYTYAYAALGELAAWIIGWDLILEYAVGNIAVAISWSGHFREFLSHFGIEIPAWLATDYRTAHEASLALTTGATDSATHYFASALSTAPRLLGFPLILNLPAAGIVVLITILLVRGIKISALMNSLIVIVKLGILVFFITVGVYFIDPHNFVAHGGFSPNGMRGIGAAAAIIFFSYIGFDTVSTAAEEARNPQRDMPFGIIMSLAVCSVLYILVAVVMTGMAPWDRLGTAEPMLTALVFSSGDTQLLSVARFVIAVGAVIAMTTVLLVFQLGQSRIFFSMGRDGLLPSWAARTHRHFHTPYVTTIVTGVLVAGIAAFADIAEVIDLTNIGTLFAFILVSLGVWLLRYIDPQRPRPFRTPFVPIVPLIAIAACLYLMLQLPLITWFRFALWLATGLILYVLYSHSHSRIRKPHTIE